MSQIYKYENRAAATQWNAVVFHESTAAGSNEVNFNRADLIFFVSFFDQATSFSDLLDSNKNKHNIQKKRKWDNLNSQKPIFIEAQSEKKIINPKFLGAHSKKP